MGMSHDFEVAIEEGATMVRVGSAIFGRDSYVSSSSKFKVQNARGACETLGVDRSLGTLNWNFELQGCSHESHSSRSAADEFKTAMRGYDRGEVEAFLPRRPTTTRTRCARTIGCGRSSARSRRCSTSSRPGKEPHQHADHGAEAGRRDPRERAAGSGARSSAKPRAARSAAAEVLRRASKTCSARSTACA